MQDLTAIILTRNEERNIGACLDSISGFASRAVVVDCGSSDRTVEIARLKGAEVVFHEFRYYADQMNWALDNLGITTEWVLRLDADERMTPEAIAECAPIMAKPRSGGASGVNGITMESIYYFLGRPMRHGIRNKRKMMIFRNGCGRMEDRHRDPYSILTEGKNVSIKSRFLHYDFKDLSSYIRRYNWYAGRELMDYIEGRRLAGADGQQLDRRLQAQRRKKYGIYYKAPRFIRCWLWFIYNYIFRLGFLDGREGFLYHYFECMWYRMLIDARIYEYEKTGRAPEALKPLD